MNSFDHQLLHVTHDKIRGAPTVLTDIVRDVLPTGERRRLSSHILNTPRQVAHGVKGIADPRLGGQLSLEGVVGTGASGTMSTVGAMESLPELRQGICKGTYV